MYQETLQVLSEALLARGDDLERVVEAQTGVLLGLPLDESQNRELQDELRLLFRRVSGNGYNGHTQIAGVRQKMRDTLVELVRRLNPA